MINMQHFKNEKLYNNKNEKIRQERWRDDLSIKKKHVIGFMLFCFVGIIATIWLMLDWKKDVSTNLHIKQNIDKIINITN